MSSFIFLCILMAVGIVLWNMDRYPRISTAGSWLFGIALFAILCGFHPAVPGIGR